MTTELRDKELNEMTPEEIAAAVARSREALGYVEVPKETFIALLASHRKMEDYDEMKLLVMHGLEGWSRDDLAMADRLVRKWKEEDEGLGTVALVSDGSSQQD